MRKLREEITCNDSISRRAKCFFQHPTQFKNISRRRSVEKLHIIRLKQERSLQRDYLTKEAGIVVEIVPPLQEWNNFFWSVLILSKQLDSLQQVLIEERPAYRPHRERERERNMRYHGEQGLLEIKGPLCWKPGYSFFIYLDSPFIRALWRLQIFYKTSNNHINNHWNESVKTRLLKLGWN